MKHYLVFVEDDIEPTVLGFFNSEDSRDEMARGLRKKHGPDHGLFPLNINSKGIPKISSYSGGFFDEEFMERFEESERQQALSQDADREMIGNDVNYGLNNIGSK